MPSFHGNCPCLPHAAIFGWLFIFFKYSTTWLANKAFNFWGLLRILRFKYSIFRGVWLVNHNIWFFWYLNACFPDALFRASPWVFFNLNFWKLEIRILSHQEKATSKPICNALIAYSATRDFGPFKQFLVLTWIVAMRGFSLAQDSLYIDTAAIPIWGLDDGSCI